MSMAGAESSSRQAARTQALQGGTPQGKRRYSNTYPLRELRGRLEVLGQQLLPEDLLHRRLHLWPEFDRHLEHNHPDEQGRGETRDHVRRRSIHSYGRPQLDGIPLFHG